MRGNNLKSELKDIQFAIQHARMEEIRNDVVLFAHHVMRDENGRPWEVPEFHKEIYGKLIDLAEHAVRLKQGSRAVDVDRSQRRNMIILAPREHGKTSLVTCLLLYLLGRYPSLRIKYVSMSDNHSKAVLGQIKKNIEKNKYLHEVFPNLREAPNGRWSATEIDIDRVTTDGEWDEADLGIKDASLAALGITSSGTGGRADFIIFDDMIGSRSAVMEPGRMEAIKTIFHQDWMNIGRYCNIVIGTPWTPDDIHAELSQHDGWHLWKKPAIDKDGNPLWPQRWPIEDLMKKKADSEANFALMYMLEGIKAKVEWWSAATVEKCKDRTLRLGELDFEPKGIVIGLDPATGQKRGSSYSCITCVAYDEFKHKTILDVKRVRAQPKVVAEMVIDMYLNVNSGGIRPETVLVENNATQQAFIDLIDVIAQNKYQDLRIPLKGHFSGGQKWNPEIGLPRLVASMDNGMWTFPWKSDGHVTNSQGKLDPLHECELCSLCKEMLGYPYDTETTDMIMSLWLADTAIEQKNLIGDLPIAGSSTRVAVGW